MPLYSNSRACQELGVTPQKLRALRNSGGIRCQKQKNGRYLYEVHEKRSVEARIGSSWERLVTTVLQLWWTDTCIHQGSVGNDSSIVAELDSFNFDVKLQFFRVLTGAFGSVVEQEPFESFCMLHIPTLLAYILRQSHVFGSTNTLALCFVLAHERLLLHTGMAPAKSLHVAACMNFSTVLVAFASKVLRLPWQASLLVCSSYTFVLSFQMVLAYKTRSADAVKFTLAAAAFAILMNSHTLYSFT